MFLKEYRKEIFRPECNPNFQSVHCIAHLGTDISEVLPYLNTVLGGSTYTQDPPSVTFKVHGKLITLHSQQIAINALKDEDEADKILRWLRQEINETWEKRDQIQPSFQGVAKPQLLEILKLLPKNNSRQCGQATCMVFSRSVADGVKKPEDCPGLKILTKPSCRGTSNNFPWNLNSSESRETVTFPPHSPSYEQKRQIPQGA